MSAEQAGLPPVDSKNEGGPVGAGLAESSETKKPPTDSETNITTFSVEGATKTEDQLLSEESKEAVGDFLVESSESKPKVGTANEAQLPGGYEEGAGPPPESSESKPLGTAEKAPQLSPEQRKKSPIRRRSKANALENPYGILSATQQEFLGSIGIQTAEQFLGTRTADLAPKFVEWRKGKGLPELKGNGPTASISAWKTKVRNTVKAMSGEGAAMQPAQAKVKVAKKQDKQLVQKQDEQAAEEEVSHGGEDPLEVLSSRAKVFLASIGIKTAVAFLTTRSSDIGPKFVEWRTTKGMTPLKGTGPVASVSAWKTTVRNKAEKMGLKRVADLNPAGMSARSPTPRRKKAAKRKRLSDIERPSQRESVRRARRIYAEPGIPDGDEEEGEKEKEEEEEEEEASEDESYGRGTDEEEASDVEPTDQDGSDGKRKRHAPPRFMDIQESLLSGKKRKKRSDKKVDEKATTGPPKKRGRPRKAPPEGSVKSPPETFVEDVEILKKP